MTNSEDQRLNGSLDRSFIIQRQKLGKYVGNYGTEDAFLTCYKSRPIHPILTQIGARKHPKLDKQAICVNSYCILSIPPTIQIFRPAAPTRGVSVPYFQAKCHFVLSNVTVRAKTIFLTQQQSVSPALPIWRHKTKIDIWTRKCFIGQFLSLCVATF